MSINPQNIVRHELIGLEVKIIKSTNSSQEGMRGRVVDETFKMLIIETNKGDKKIAKKDAVFVFKLPDGTRVKVDGKILLGRPEDRIKKKLKRW